jgi:hypothetical protein
MLKFCKLLIQNALPTKIKKKKREKKIIKISENKRTRDLRERFSKDLTPQQREKRGDRSKSAATGPNPWFILPRPSHSVLFLFVLFQRRVEAKLSVGGKRARWVCYI